MKTAIFFQFLYSIIVLIIILIVFSLSRKMINKFGYKQNFHARRVFYARKVSALFHTLVFLLLLSIIWGFNLEGLPIYFASFFGIVGIAFFASWSVLSNITASLIVFFSAPYKISDTIKIIDGENSVTGKIVDMTMFNIYLETESKSLVTYPNNVIIQKPVQLL